VFESTVIYFADPTTRKELYAVFAHRMQRRALRELQTRAFPLANDAGRECVRNIAVMY
jgi:hypothetical protein